MRFGVTAGICFNPRLRAGGDDTIRHPQPRRYVSIHASAREATLDRSVWDAAVEVSIHASAREATSARPSRASTPSVFQSTPPRGRRRRSASACAAPASFNPRLRAGGDRSSARWCPCSPCFNPRLRAGGDVPPGTGASPTIRVSIHASAREATRRCWLWVTRRRCFNPRLRAGGDRRRRPPGPRPPCFNPRLRAGGDARRMALVAPYSCFNPRLRAGGDPSEPSTPTSTVPFQSTPPRGRRQLFVVKVAEVDMFQSTPPRGRRHDRRIRMDRRRQVSIHASAREATRQPRDPRPVARGFNPRLRAGGDDIAAPRSRGRDVSIHASAREATPGVRAAFNHLMFQSTPPRGRRLPGRIST